MSHLYPIAESAADALERAELVALTRYEAEALAGDREIERLETEWLTPPTDDVIAMMDTADAGPGQGFVQRYENEKGDPILAVTYWKLGGPAKAKKTIALPASPQDPENDHTDDLYFREGRTKPARKRRRKKYVDPRQIDMFPPATEDSGES